MIRKAARWLALPVRLFLAWLIITLMVLIPLVILEWMAGLIH